MQGTAELQNHIKECSYRFNILKNTTAQCFIYNVHIVIIKVEGLLSECFESVNAENILH